MNNRDYNVNGFICMYNSFRGLLHLLLELTQRTLSKRYTYNMILLPNVFRICLVISLREAVHWPGFLIFWLWVYLMKFMPEMPYCPSLPPISTKRTITSHILVSALNQYNVSKWSDISISGCWFSEIAQQRSNKAHGSSTKRTPPWFHWT